MQTRTKNSTSKQPAKRITKAELERQVRVREGLGKYAWVPTSSDQFAARKEQEIELEEHVNNNRLPPHSK
ncbi:MAG TPA: hypothetical protein VGM92_10070 [Candidatus Kapabacteria bacterium]|jgi:hypothetical protein